MAITPSLERQHTEILNICDNLVKELQSLYNKEDQKHEKRLLVTQINTLLGKLLVNLSMKDRVLYPEAVEATDNKALSAKALELMYEMGRLKASLYDYREHILMHETSDDVFVQKTISMINSVKKKIAKEEHDLYPLFKAYKEQKDKANANHQIALV